jgi:tetratricopeptide (TPR) repeat protein
VKLKDLDPGYNWFSGGWAILKLLQGNYPEALRLAQADPEPEAKEVALAMTYSRMGKPDQSKQAVERLLRIPTVSAYNIACVHAYRGEKDLAFGSLEAAYQQHLPDLIVLKIDPLLANLRSDPRYHALVRKMNLPESP